MCKIFLCAYYQGQDILKAEEAGRSMKQLTKRVCLMPNQKQREMKNV